MAEKSNFLIEIMAVASILAVVDVLVAFLGQLIISEMSVFHTASTLLLFEFAVMLILGGCLMARQPLEDEKRFDADGNPVPAWRMAIIGKKILGASLFTLLLSVLFLILGNYF